MSEEKKKNGLFKGFLGRKKNNTEKNEAIGEPESAEETPIYEEDEKSSPPANHDLESMLKKNLHKDFQSGDDQNIGDIINEFRKNDIGKISRLKKDEEEEKKAIPVSPKEGETDNAPQIASSPDIPHEFSAPHQSIDDLIRSVRKEQEKKPDAEPDPAGEEQKEKLPEKEKKSSNASDTAMLSQMIERMKKEAAEKEKTSRPENISPEGPPAEETPATLTGSSTAGPENIRSGSLSEIIQKIQTSKDWKHSPRGDIKPEVRPDQKPAEEETVKEPPEPGASPETEGLIPDLTPPQEEKKADLPHIADEGVNADEKVQSLIQDIVKSHDNVLKKKEEEAPIRRVTMVDHVEETEFKNTPDSSFMVRKATMVEEPEEGVNNSSPEPDENRERAITISSAKKTKWSEPEEEKRPKKGVVSVDEIEDYSDMILPKGATFDIEEFRFEGKATGLDFANRNEIFAEIAQIGEMGLPSMDIPAAELETGISTGKTDEKKTKKGRGFFKKVLGYVEEYDPAVHGSLVDLSMDESSGFEEIELYPVNEPFAYIRIAYDNAAHEYIYTVIEPVLTDAEEVLLEELTQRLFETLDINTKDLTKEKAINTLSEAVIEIIKDYGIKLDPKERAKILYHIKKNFLGDGRIDPIMHDKFIEDISCDGLGAPIFVYHANYESIQTNLSYENTEELDSFVTKLAQRAGKYISIAEPMLDATMADGSRIQMTLGMEVTAHGSTFTIRKFKDEPITPTDLIEWGTYSPLSIAYLWICVESGKSCIFAGGTASGKTTSLNAISLFIPPLAKIVTLEDTRELKLPHKNWIPSVTRESFDSEGKGTIDMYELLRAALRQRPEYILVGEVRGQEAQTLFQAMSTGHVTYATTHADSVASVVHRFENPPMNVPRNMLSALDLVSVQVQARLGGQRIRRNKQLIEILDIDPRTKELITNEVFKWNPATDEIRYSGKSYILEEVMESKGWSEARMREELKRRQEILEWMRIKKLRHYQEVGKVLLSYYRDPESVMDLVRADLYE